MRLNHRLVESFRVVLLTGSATRAAELLFTSQPAISRDLARLEQLLRFSLFERSKGRLLPTAQGLAFYEEVKRSYIGLTTLAARAEEIRTLNMGKLSVAALPALCDSLLPAAFALFRRNHPGVLLQITALESPQLESALSEQRFDLGLVEHNLPPVGTTTELLFKGKELVILPQSHALSAKRRLSIRDLSGQAFVSYGPEDPYRRVDALFEENGVHRNVVAETTSASSLFSLVRNGIGIAIVNPITPRYANHTGVISAALTPTIAYEVAMVKPVHRPTNPLVSQFFAYLRRCIASKDK
jgi:DNA-binding transcriptional LysR family regulator